MGKNDIINYVMETPGNSNPAVLGSMLESYSSGGSGGGGWVEEFTWWLNPENPQYDLRAISTHTADEILAAYRTGANVVFHIPVENVYEPKDDPFLGTHFNGGYYTVVSIPTGVAERYDEATNTAEHMEMPFDSFQFSNATGIPLSTSAHESGWERSYPTQMSIFNMITIADDGKLHLHLCID